MKISEIADQAENILNELAFARLRGITIEDFEDSPIAYRFELHFGKKRFFFRLLNTNMLRPFLVECDQFIKDSYSKFNRFGNLK